MKKLIKFQSGYSILKKIKLSEYLFWEFIVLLFVVVFNVGCKKYLNVEAPFTSINEENVYADDGTAASVLTGIYGSMSGSNNGAGAFTGNTGISLEAGLSADEFVLYEGVTRSDLIAYYTNSLSSNATQSFGSEYWSSLYSYIFKTNAAIEGLTRSTTLSEKVKKQLLGEAKFLRGFFYFYLVNLYGDVPLALTTDHQVNSKLSRSTSESVYQQIILDLSDAEDLLDTHFLSSDCKSETTERIRPTKWAASALLSRAYLYIKNYAKAQQHASSVIENASQFGLSSVNEVFLKNSTEAIWQLQPVNYDYNTEDGFTFILPESGPSDLSGPFGNPVYLSDQLLRSFENDDLRGKSGNWINSIDLAGKTYYYPFKYKAVYLVNGEVTEYLMVLRLAEQYLIRAEAYANQDKLENAYSDLNVLRHRAGLPDLIGSDKETLLEAILHERQVELFSEWGHRWMDLKRTEKVDAVMSAVSPLKGGAWQVTDKLYPILFSDIEKNNDLVQNPGY